VLGDKASFLTALPDRAVGGAWWLQDSSTAMVEIHSVYSIFNIGFNSTELKTQDELKAL
jgi:hypothetical protein